MKNKILPLLLAATMIISIFTGCGNDNTSNSGPNNGDSSNISDSIEEKSEWTLSEYLKSGTTIWFQTTGPEKDASVSIIYVMEPDGTLLFCHRDYFPSESSSLGVFEQMSDEEIISGVKEGYKTMITKLINKVEEQQASFLANRDDGYESVDSTESEYYSTTISTLKQTLKNLWYL